MTDDVTVIDANSSDIKPTVQNRIVSDLLTYLPAKVLPSITPFLTVPIYTHLFSPDVYGHYVLAFGISELLLAATITGFASGAVRFFVAFKQDGKLKSYFAAILISFLVMVAAGSLISGASMLALKSTLSADLYRILWVAIPTYAATALSELLMTIIRAQERSRVYSVFEILNRVGTVVLSLVLVLVFDAGVEGLLWGQAIMMALTSVPLIYLLAQALENDNTGTLEISRSDLTRLWSFSLPLAFGYIAMWGLRMSDRYVIEYFWDSYEVGLYSVGYRIASRSIMFLVGLFWLVPAPIITRVWEEEGREATENALTSVTRYFFLLIIPAVTGFAVLAKPLVVLLASDEYLDGYRAGWLIALAMMAQGLSELAMFGMLLATRSRIVARNQLIVAGFNLLMNALLVPRWGFMGAGVTAVTSFSLLVVLHARASAPHLTWRWPLDSLAKVVTAAALMGVIAYVIASGVVSLSTFSETVTYALALLLAVVAGIAVYGAVLWALGEEAIRSIVAFIITPDPRKSASSGDTAYAADS